MKKYLYMSLMLALSVVLSISFTSCNNDDDLPTKPIVTLTEVGHDNSKHAHRGHDMHLEAKVTAEGLIKRIDIEIHQEGIGNFKIEKAYTDGKNINVRELKFHEHIDIPKEAPLGKYHLHFTVTDKHGQKATAESSLEIVAEEEGHEHEHHEH